MKQQDKVLYWTPRIICILAILFISLFALDSFEQGRTLWQNLLAFLIHLIPSFVLLVMLIIAWKWERAGGFIFLITGCVLVILYGITGIRNGDNSLLKMLGWGMMLFSPFILAGILFILSHNRKEHKTPLQ